jgi:hypothetical protein
MEGWSECGGWGMMLLPFGREMQAASGAGPERAECGGTASDWWIGAANVHMSSLVTLQYSISFAPY